MADNRTLDLDLPALLEAQAARESEGLAAGVARFRAAVEKAEQEGRASQQGAASSLLRFAMEPMTKAVAEWLENADGRTAKHAAFRLVSEVGAEAAAYMTCRVVLDTIGQKADLRRACQEVARRLCDELRFRKLKAEAPGLFEYRLERLNTSHYSHAARSLNAAVNYAEVDVSEYHVGHDRALQIGSKLVDLLMASTGLVERVDFLDAPESARAKPTMRVYLTPTKETKEWLLRRNSRLELLCPVAQPMVVPPLPWAPDREGGYRFALRGRYDFIRDFNREAAAQAPVMPAVYEAANRLQETAWRININILDLIRAVRDTGVAVGGIPSFEPIPLPPRPLDIDENPDSRRAWRDKAHEVHEANHVRKMKAVWFSKVIASAEGVQNYSAIWFPWTLDFRGRVYPVSDYLHPQGPDVVKALLMFADGEPIGESGARWLAIHLANCLGVLPDGRKVSKLSHDDRVKWVGENEGIITQIAADPLGNRPLWQDADEPFQFVAACIEWANFVKEGLGYICHLPVGIDGTCNGLQHLSAMIRDEVGGQAVNLTPHLTPADVYDDVATQVGHALARVVVDEKADDRDRQFASWWMRSGLVNRKLAKRPTMTFGYGSARFGFGQQIADWLREQPQYDELRKEWVLIDEETGAEKPAVRAMSVFIADLLWDALALTIPRAFAAREWLQKAARIVARSGVPAEWTVPETGFHVRQRYFKQTSRRIETVIAGRVYFPSHRTDTAEVDARKQANAIAPNFVHSLDAAALMLTVKMASAQGVTAFGMVHDSYSSVPAHVEILSRIARQAFHRLYAGRNALEDLRQELQALVKPNDKGKVEEIPPAPALGTLDLGLVLASPYFFS